MQNEWVKHFSLKGICPATDTLVSCTLGPEGEWLCTACGVEH